MGKYTYSDNLKVDSYIDNYLDQVIAAIFDDLPKSLVISILLAGSYGKGEGSVILDGESIKPLRDFDICIIVPKDKIPSPFFIKNLQDKLRNKFCLINDYTYQLTSDQLPEISITTLENINSNPDISSFDLKKCKVLYGKDIRQEIRWGLEDIPLRTNGRALFQKSIALIGSFHSGYSKSSVPKNAEASFIRETSRAYIEICVGLCLLAKKYESYSLKRLDTVKKIFDVAFPELKAEIPDLVEKIEKSTLYKLDPFNNKLTVDPIDYWFTVRNDLGIFIKYYYKKYLDVSATDWIDFSSQIEKKMSNHYYLPIIDAYLKSRPKWYNGLPISCFNYFYNIRENVAFSGYAYDKGYVSLPLFKGIASPAIKAFAIAPLILFGINRDNSFNNDYINLAKKKLRFVKIYNQRFESDWDEIRSKFLDLIFAVNMI